MPKFIPQGMGWIPDLPDPRDYTYRHKEILPILKQLKTCSGELPDEVDLRYGDEGEVFLTDVEDQGPLNSSTAFAVLSLIEYFERREGRTFSGSRLFLYKVARNLRCKRADNCDDTGADLRTTLKALRHFGIPSEEIWPYEPAYVNEEPHAFVYQSAKPVASFHYYRLFPAYTNSKQTSNEKHSDSGYPTRWKCVQSILASGFPIAFGFSVPSSLSADPNIPYRPEFDNYLGGMAALAIGYNSHCYGRNQGAILVRTSWGSEWGDNGNGWLPAAALDSGLFADCWTVAVTPKP